MPATATLQLLVFRHPGDTDVAPYEDAIVRAFQGGKEAGGYLASGEDLGIQLEVFSSAPTLAVAEAVDSFCLSRPTISLDSLLREGE